MEDEVISLLFVGHAMAVVVGLLDKVPVASGDDPSLLATRRRCRRARRLRTS